MKFLQNVHSYDLYTFDWCLRRKHLALFTTMSRWVSKSADGHLYVLAGLMLLISQQWQLASILCAALTAERLVYWLLKSHFRRNRPPQAIPGFKSVVQPGDQFSFPSGHTSAAFLMATLINHWLPDLGWMIYTWASLVGISRVFLGVHFPTDTLAGATLGISFAYLALSVI